MDMQRQKKLKDQLKSELELLCKRKLSNTEACDAYFNLRGFFHVLKQMKKEAEYAKAI